MSRRDAALLTRRQWVVLCLWIAGASHQQIADSLGISRETAKSTIRDLSRKCGIHGRMEAAVMGADIPHK